MGLCKESGASEAKGAGILGRFPGQLEVVMVASFIKTGDNRGQAGQGAVRVPSAGCTKLGKHVGKPRGEVLWLSAVQIAGPASDVY